MTEQYLIEQLKQRDELIAKKDNLIAELVGQLKQRDSAMLSLLKENNTITKNIEDAVIFKADESEVDRLLLDKSMFKFGWEKTFYEGTRQDNTRRGFSQDLGKTPQRVSLKQLLALGVRDSSDVSFIVHNQLNYELQTQRDNNRKAIYDAVDKHGNSAEKRLKEIQDDVDFIQKHT